MKENTICTYKYDMMLDKIIQCINTIHIFVVAHINTTLYKYKRKSGEKFVLFN